VIQAPNPEEKTNPLCFVERQRREKKCLSSFVTNSLPFSPFNLIILQYHQEPDLRGDLIIKGTVSTFSFVHLLSPVASLCSTFFPTFQIKTQNEFNKP